MLEYAASKDQPKVYFENTLKIKSPIERNEPVKNNYNEGHANSIKSHNNLLNLSILKHI